MRHSLRRLSCCLFILSMLAVLHRSAFAQSTLSGRILGPRFEGSDERMPYSAVYVFANQTGADNEALSFRTWETAPAGWFQLKGAAGNYTIVCTSPASFMRPIVRTNQVVRDGEKLDQLLTPRADYAVFDESKYDTKQARAYYQLFTATGTSVTSIGFRVAHDGVDGGGPGKQDFHITVHRKPGKTEEGKETPQYWPQVGWAGVVLDVDSGGAKNYLWSAGWNSGEMELEPGAVYAACVKPRKVDGVFQAFWQDTTEESHCYRIGSEGTGTWVKQNLWLSIATDGDGLVIPYQKRVHKQFGELTKFSSKWSQTYVARGRSLCSVVLYAAVSGSQPALRRQRCMVRLREGGPDGKVIGTSKIAVGNGAHTGDASWGVFGVTFEPGEVPVEPGKTYAIEFESMESFDTLDGYVNIKGVRSNNQPGFNPYRKQAQDHYPQGKAVYGGDNNVDYDLDMQIIEYEHAPRGPWRDAVEAQTLIDNGSMLSGIATGDRSAVDRWKPFAGDRFERSGLHQWKAIASDPPEQFARIGGDANDGPINAGYMQQVTGLDRGETYRLTARLRCSWPRDDEHACEIGYDPTGQATDPAAKTIQWQAHARVHGVWIDFRSEPIRPAKDAISIWLRGRTSAKHDRNHAFKADFDDVELYRVLSAAPPASAMKP